MPLEYPHRVWDSKKCKVCGGDGMRVIPIKNTEKLAIKTSRGWIVPDYLVEIVECKECHPN